jgi:Putative adhesin
VRTLAGAAALAGSAVLAGAAVAGCGLSFSRHAEDRSYTAPDGVGALKVSPGDGSVQITASDSPGIKVTEHLRWSNDRNKPEPRHDVAGRTLSLSAKCGHSVIGSNPCRISYRIQVPRATAVEVRGGAGSIKVAGLAGTVRLHGDTGSVTATDLRTSSATVGADSGNVRVSGRAGTADLRTDTGSITATGLASGRLTARAGSGDVRLGGRITSAEVRTDTGSLRADGLTADRLAVETNSGSIALGLAVAPSAVQATTDTGSVLLRLPAARPYAVALSTDTGGKQIAPGIHQDSASSRRITVKTGSGGISIKPA